MGEEDFPNYLKPVEDLSEEDLRQAAIDDAESRHPSAVGRLSKPNEVSSDQPKLRLVEDEESKE